LQDHRAIAIEVEATWLSVCREALGLAQAAMVDFPLAVLRLHGDCHPGNILWTPVEQVNGGPHFVDLDDARMGPAVQDLWMLLSGDRRDRSLQLSQLLEGYESMRPFDRRELAWIEPLRTLRLVHYSAWLARRQDDRICAALCLVWHRRLLARPGEHPAGANRGHARAATASLISAPGFPEHQCHRFPRAPRHQPAGSVAA